MRYAHAMPKPYIPNDSWSKRAAKEGYRARSVYKLQELDETYHLLRPGMKVLDLGAAPGSWLQYVSRRIGPKGRAVGIDLTPINAVAENVQTCEGDVTDPKVMESVLSTSGLQTFDLVLSDMAPSTSGVKDIDQWQSVELARAAAGLARSILAPQGVFVVKVFRGEDFDPLLRELKQNFSDVRMAKTKASRDRSREIYLVMKKKLG